MSATTPDTQEATVLVRRDGALGRITLNRPKAINALTLEMVHRVDAALDDFAADADVATVLLDGAGERGFCAGGDVVALHDAAKAGDPSGPRAFWHDEYQLNARIGAYPKPVVAIMDGIVMGGGVGLAGHASHRVATERLNVAMPEVGIGFAPDVGGTWLLANAPGQLGAHLALTAGRAVGADAIVCGLADHYVPSDRVDALITALAHDDLDSALAAAQEPPPPGTLTDAREWIDAAYSADSAEEILANLRARPEPAAQEAAEAIATKSPTSVKVALHGVRSAAKLPSLEAALAQEYRVSLAFLTCPDFVEGIRAALVDKDRQPRWNPSTLEDVDVATVERFFAPLRDTPELEFTHA